ncbi:GNAT family N-acetyltransferase [Wenzhouxiangella sp. EGI_FJ10305]|uniref:GNAT family N-acetyltransferase n=1 Tax=Wenzhouxiangella sp. EGI_FJ10305 TaxID=3243768 RepID=UPI0035DF1E29
MSTKLRIESISSNRAKAFWRESPQATAFTQPEILEQCASQVDWWGAWRSDDLVAACPVCRSPDDVKPFRPTFLYYVGPMFSGEIHAFKYHRFQAVRQQALDALIPFLVDRYPRLRFSMPPGETDVRAFEWWNHDNPKGPAFVFRARHTARIHDLDRPVEEIREDFARNRKRDLRMLVDAQPIRSDDWLTDELIELHDRPLLRQGIKVPDERTRALRNVVSAAAQGHGDVLAWRDPEDGSLASFIVLLHGRDESNDVLCVASDKWRQRGLSAWTTWQGILHARSLGRKIFDFNGANSPRRAADKHAFGARAELYFTLDMDGGWDAVV